MKAKMLVRVLRVAGACALAASVLSAQQSPAAWVEYAPGVGPGAGKRVLLVSGDDEYRSEEALPMLGEVLAARHGFACRVTFSIDPETGEIDPEEKVNLPGLDALERADVLVLFTRFRRLSDADMARVAAYVESGRPLIAIRTATHAFAYETDSPSPYRHWSWDWNGPEHPEWQGGFGQHLLGTSWVAHHGAHGAQSTRGVIAAGAAEHPILRGVRDVWGPSDVYAVRALPADVRVLLDGAVLAGMTPDSAPVEGAQNAPRMPLVWLRERELAGGVRQRVVCSTIGAAVDLQSEDLRRLLVNAVYWCAGLEAAIPERAAVEPLRPYDPTTFGFGGFRRGLRPSDFAAR
jgi:type 1 glutamine amidotransferase